MKLNFDLLPEIEKMEDAETFNNENIPFYESISSDEEADEILSKLIWAKNKVEEADKKIKAKKKQLQEQLKEYESRLKSKLENYAAFQSDLLYNYISNKLKDKNGNINKGSIKLFNGTISLKEARGSIIIDNEKEENIISLLEQLGKNKCINITKSVSKLDFAKEFKLDKSGHYFITEKGEIIQGVELQKPDKLQLSITKPKSKNI